MRHLRSRWCLGVSVAWLLTAAAWVTPTSAIEVVIRGVDDPDPEQLAKAVMREESLVRFVAPSCPDSSLAKAVEEMVGLALERAGYPEPRVDAVVQRAVVQKAVVEGRGDGTGEAQRVVVDVTPGKRYHAGAIRVEGLDEPLADGLQQWLRSRQPASDAKPRVVDAGNVPEIEWVTDQGRPAKLNDPLWSQGKPAAFDAPFIASVRRSTARFLQEEGFLLAAAKVEKKTAAIDACQVSVDLVNDGSETATLMLRFEEAGPAAIVERVVIEGTDRISADIVGDYLGITPGQRITAADLRVWEERLRLSGRFIRQEVSCGPSAKDGSTAVVCRLLPHPDVTPLGMPLTREEVVMLRFRSWLMASLDGEGLEVRWVRPDEAVSPALLLSSEHGAVLTSGLGDDRGGLAVTASGLGVFLPRGDGRFEMPLMSLGQAMVHASLSVRDTVDEKAGVYRHDLSLSASFGSSHGDVPAAAVTARIEPVACLAIVHRRPDGNHGIEAVHWDGDVLEIAQADGRARFEAATGRLLELDLGAAGRVVIANVVNWQDAIAALERGAGNDLYDPAAPMSSAIAFLGRDGARELVQRALLATGWQPTAGSPWPGLARAVHAAAADGGFAKVDRYLSSFLAERSRADRLPTIPSTREKPRGGDPIMTAIGIFSGKLAIWLDGSCGRDAWPTGLARLARAMFQQDGAASLQEAASLMASDRAGPLAHLVAASVVPLKPAAASFALRGRGRIDAAAFRTDCEPVLAVFAASGLDDAAVSVLRRLDDDAARSIGQQCLSDRDGFKVFLDILTSPDGDSAAVGELSRALGAWWDASLCEVVTAALEERAGGRVAAGDQRSPLIR